MGNTIFRIGTCDVVIQDYGDGRGKLILSDDDYDHNVSYYWGCMGEGYDLSKFIQKTSTEYLVRKLGKRDSDGPIDMKKTMRNVRKFIREETEWRFYMDTEADKELRRELNEIQSGSYDENNFIQLMSNINPVAWLDKSYYQTEWNDMIEQLKCEPWHFIQHSLPEVNVWLFKFIPKLQSYLKKESEVTNGK